MNLALQGYIFSREFPIDKYVTLFDIIVGKEILYIKKTLENYILTEMPYVNDRLIYLYIHIFLLCCFQERIKFEICMKCVIILQQSTPIPTFLDRILKLCNASVNTCCIVCFSAEIKPNKDKPVNMHAVANICPT